MKRLLINAGNTNIEFALADDSTINDYEKIDTRAFLNGEKESAILKKNSDCEIIAATVVPELETCLEQYDIHWFDRTQITCIDLSQIELEQMGADRLANALAASVLCPLPVIVIDSGTAISTEILDANKKLLGGMIMPGRRVMRNALSRDTALLPEIPWQNERPEPYAGNTVDAMRAGIDLGCIGALEKLITATIESLGTDCHVIVIGGDKDFISDHLEIAENGPEHFTLRGLIIYAQGLKKS
ncbi:MAG: type III pantothenate kinase [Lentisphaeria bacterium]|nr:type III pantothenate kinase [Lentisphaeria bacterium]